MTEKKDPNPKIKKTISKFQYGTSLVLESETATIEEMAETYQNALLELAKRADLIHIAHKRIDLKTSKQEYRDGYKKGKFTK